MASYIEASTVSDTVMTVDYCLVKVVGNVQMVKLQCHGVV